MVCWKAVVTLTACWPVIASSTSSRCCDGTASVIALSSASNSGSTCSRPAVSMMITSALTRRASAGDSRAIATGSVARGAYAGALMLLASTSSCSIAAGRPTSGDTSSRRWTSRSSKASRTSRSPASTSASLNLPRPVSFLSAWSRRSVRESNTLGPHQPELALVVVEIGGGPPHHVVDGGSRDAFTLRDLAIGPVELPGQVEDAPLMVGQQRAVEIEQAQLALPALGTVKHLALTVYRGALNRT